MKYYNIDKLPNNNKTASKSGDAACTSKLNCMLVNARSLNRQTVDDLLNIIFVDEKIDICSITETWLKPGDQAVLADIKLRGYEIISSPRANNKRGGVLPSYVKRVINSNS